MRVIGESNNDAVENLRKLGIDIFYRRFWHWIFKLSYLKHGALTI